MDTEIIVNAVGINGQIELFKNRIDIKRKGFRAFISQGFDGTKTLFIKKLSGLQFKEAGGMTNGFIQFVISGSSESKGGIIDATKDENTVMFNKDQMEDFMKIRNFIIEILEM